MIDSRKYPSIFLFIICLIVFSLCIISIYILGNLFENAIRDSWLYFLGFISFSIFSFLIVSIFRRRSSVEHVQIWGVSILLLFVFYYFFLPDPNRTPIEFFLDRNPELGRAVFWLHAYWGFDAGSALSDLRFFILETIGAILACLFYVCLTVLLAFGRVFRNKARNSYSTWLNNRTVGLIVGGNAWIVAPLLVTLMAGIGVYPEYAAWRDYAAGFPWHLTVAALVHLGFLVQKPPPSVERQGAGGGISQEQGPISIKPIYDRIVSAPVLSDHLVAHWVEAPDGAGHQPEFGVEKEHLMNGGTFLRRGAADAGFYALVSEMVDAMQNRGELAVVICPDGAAGHVKGCIDRLMRSGLPAQVRRSIVLSRGSRTAAQTFDPDAIYDLIIAEEDSFLAFFERERQDLRNVIHRTGLFVLIDFHEIDASRFYKALKNLEPSEFPRRVGLMALSCNRFGIESQLHMIRSQLPRPSDPHVKHGIAHPATTGWIAWRSSDALRRQLLGHADVSTDDDRLQLAPYLALLVASEPDRATASLPRVYVAPASLSSDYAHLITQLTGAGKLTPEFKEALSTIDHLSHYAPDRNIRIITKADRGNLADCLAAQYAFWRADTDHLVNIVSTGYPGCRYLYQRLRECLDADATSVARSFVERFMPMAQQPGIGLAEAAEYTARRMQQPEGLSEAGAAKLLNMSSGKIRQYTGVVPSRKGLETLFSIVVPGFGVHIGTDIDDGQYETYRMTMAGNPIIADTTVDVVQETAGGAGPGHPNVLGELALGDEGLLYGENEVVRQHGGYLRVVSVDTAGRQITANVAGRLDLAIYPEPIHYFARRYDILLNAGGVDDLSFVGERFRKSRLRNHQEFDMGLMAATIDRTSDHFLRMSVDQEPVPSLNDPSLLHSLPGAGVHRRRPYRNILILSFPRSCVGDADERILFRTLAASLQTVTGLMFPALRRRLAVLPILDALDAPTTESQSFYCLFPRGRLVGTNLARLIDVFAGREQDSRAEGIGDGDVPDPLGIVIIEDGEHDLGICRRMFENWTEVQRRWSDFLDWAGEQDEWCVDNLVDARLARDFAMFRSSDGPP